MRAPMNGANAMSKQAKTLRSVASVILLCGTVSAIRAQDGPPPAPVQVGFALEQNMAPHTWVPGTVMSRSTAAIASEVPGQLTWVAEVGDGQPVRIDSGCAPGGHSGRDDGSGEDHRGGGP